MAKAIEIPEPKIARLLFSDTRFSWLWLALRIYLGWQWIAAGWDKFENPAWAGPQAGTTLKSFLMGALAKSAGSHPDVSGWYASFINGVVIPHTAIFSYIVTYGEILVGIGLVIGAFTGIAAFFGMFMNLNYLFAGTVSTNPLLLVIGLLLMLAWRNAGWIGLDQWLLPKLGVPWQQKRPA